MNYHYGFFDALAVPAYPNSTPAMKPAIYFIKPPCLPMPIMNALVATLQPCVTTVST